MREGNTNINILLRTHWKDLQLLYKRPKMKVFEGMGRNLRNNVSIDFRFHSLDLGERLLILSLSIKYRS